MSHSFRLGDDLTRCSGNGLIAEQGTRAYTIDLNGHRISGRSGSSVGIATNIGSLGINIKNGVISGFGVADIDMNSDNGSIKNMVLTDAGALNDGIALHGASNVVSGNTVTRNPVGIQSFGDNNTISGNTVDANDTGIYVEQASNNVITANSTIGNSGTGINLDSISPGASDGNSITGNTSIGNGGAGINVQGGATNTGVRANIARGNIGSGIRVGSSQTTNVGDGTATGANLADANGSDGIEIAGSTGAGNAVNKNTAVGNRDNGIYGDSAVDSFTNNAANENGANGIQLSVAPTALSGNTTDGNGRINGLDNVSLDFGILLVSGTITDSTNEASHNAGSGQCSPASACTAGDATAPTVVHCGDTISAAATLNNPLDCGSGFLTINGTGPFTVGLGDHYIHTQSANTSAIALLGSNVTVTGGVIRADGGDAIDTLGTGNSVSSFVVSNSKYGVATESTSSGNTFSNGVVTLTQDRGAYIGGTNNSLASTVIAGAQSAAGVIFFGDGTTTGPKLTSLTVIGTTGDGIDVQSVQSGKVTGSTVIGSSGDGINVAANNGRTTSHSTFALNHVIASDGTGLYVQGDFTANGLGVTRNTFSKNVLKDSADSGFFLDTDPDSTHNLVTGNTVAANGGDAGMYFASEIFGTRVLSNNSSNNDFDGIDFEDPATATVIKNVVIHNGFLDPPETLFGLGLEDGNSGPAAHGCGNIGKRNFNPEQIAPSKLKAPCP